MSFFDEVDREAAHFDEPEPDYDRPSPEEIYEDEMASRGHPSRYYWSWDATLRRVP